MPARLGKGFTVKGDKITSVRHKMGSKSDQIRKAKSRKPKAVGRAKAVTASTMKFK